MGYGCPIITLGMTKNEHCIIDETPGMWCARGVVPRRKQAIGGKCPKGIIWSGVEWPSPLLPELRDLVTKRLNQT